MDKLIIGRKEIAHLPTFGLWDKTVKIDSGAYTSSINAEGYRIENNILYVSFEKDTEEMAFKNYKVKAIKSSNGIAQNRYIIKGDIQLGEHIYPTQFSLTDRSRMKYPILLGRKLLNKNFLIDTSKAYQLALKTVK